MELSEDALTAPRSAVLVRARGPRPGLIPGTVRESFPL